MFFFTGLYETIAQAEQDYDGVKQLHDSGQLGCYDAAVARGGRSLFAPARSRSLKREPAWADSTRIG